MNQLMMADGITFAWRGETVMACGNSTKIEYCTFTSGVYEKDTPFEVEVPKCWVKNKIPLEEVSSPVSPCKGPWPMLTCGPPSFREKQSRVCRRLAGQWQRMRPSGPTSFMVSKEKPHLSFLLENFSIMLLHVTGLHNNSIMPKLMLQK